MSRASRKDRKVQRERALRATDRGLPAQAPEAYKPRRSVQQGPLDRPPPGDVSDRAIPEQRRGWLSQWPVSMKVLGFATLVLLAISLWRTIAARTGP